ncbi:MAG: HNH endonuclease [Armatimonadia bacterium]
MKGRAITYSSAELAWIEAHAREPRAEAHAAFREAFQRSDVTQGNFTALCKRKGWLTGRDTRFQKGQASWNAGKSYPARGNAVKTQFKKGQLPHNTKYLGHERLNVEGYVEISVAERNPHTGYERRYVLKHIWLWQQVNGPVPKGHCLKCLDGNRANTDPSNWIAVPRALLPRLNGRFGRNFDGAPAELKPVILAIAKLEHQAREQRRMQKEHNPGGPALCMSVPGDGGGG